MELLQLDKTPIYKRIIFGVFAIFILCFASIFIALSLIHIVNKIINGTIPWPLVGFAFLAVPFGGLMVYIGFRYRVWVFPYQFTVDKSQNVCGYLWKKSWVDVIDLIGIVSLVTVPTYSQDTWPWGIYADFGEGRERKMILNSHNSFNTEREAFEHSLKIGSKIASYLDVPIEFDEWSSDVS